MPERIVSDVRSLLDSGEAPGAAVALVVDGQMWSTGTGHATLDRSRTLNAAARFSAYSITKTVIATIIMRLVEDGALSLDDPLTVHMPDLPFEIPVSVRQVLNHTGGLPDYGGMAEYHRAVRDHPETPWISDEYLERTLGGGLLFEPGQGWSYSKYRLHAAADDDRAGYGRLVPGGRAAASGGSVWIAGSRSDRVAR